MPPPRHSGESPVTVALASFARHSKPAFFQLRTNLEYVVTRQIIRAKPDLKPNHCQDRSSQPCMALNFLPSRRPEYHVNREKESYYPILNIFNISFPERKKTPPRVSLGSSSRSKVGYLLLEFINSSSLFCVNVGLGGCQTP